MDGLLGVCAVLAALCLAAQAYSPRFFLGRPRDGLVKRPDVHRMSIKQQHQLQADLPTGLWFEQRLDHFTPTDTRTWKQRYFKAGPASSDTLFVMIGGEGAAYSGWMTTGMWSVWGEAHRAVRLQLEHRYFGKSHPTSDTSLPNLRYLHSEQALADLAEFITAKKKEFRATKVIVFGGSYSGVLAAWLRLKYPHLVDGAVASSAPVLAQVDFKGYLEVVTQSLNTTNPANACISAISNATTAFHQNLETEEGRKALFKQFNLCDAIEVSNKKDISNLYLTLAGAFMETVQYNKISQGPPTIDDVCSSMTDTSTGKDVLQRYAETIQWIFEGQCVDFQYDKMIKELKNSTEWAISGGIGYRQWVYMTCTEFGFYQSSDSDNQPFGHDFPIGFNTQICADVFGPELNPKLIYSAIDATNVEYGGRHFTQDRVVFVNGDIDPWHYLGITHKLPHADRKSVV